jgi:hypothetical protein
MFARSPNKTSLARCITPQATHYYNWLKLQLVEFHAPDGCHHRTQTPARNFLVAR